MAEGRSHRAMHRRPVGPSSRKEMLQAEQPRGPTHTDPQRIAIVSRRHPGPARQAFFTKRTAAEIPCRAEEQRDSADVERSAEQRDDGHPGIRQFEWIARIVSTQGTGEDIPKSENAEISGESPNRPECDSSPGDRARQWRPQVFQKHYQGRQGQPGIKQDRNYDGDDDPRKASLLLFALPAFEI